MFPFLLEAAGIETFVSKDIEDFELCPLVDGPSLNITHKEEYESITVCWRFLTTAYPHCAGSWGVPFAVEPYPEGAKYTFMFLLYPPISGMSQDGKHAAWMGVSFEETSEGKGHQITWRSILFDKPLKIFEWQNMCVSYSKQTKKFLVFHNGVKYVDILIKEDHIFISKYFLSQIIINRQQRGSFSDLQVYSTPMDEASLSSWTTCTYNEAGDVYAWDISKFNLTHDETIISAIEEVDTSLFCKSNQKNKNEIHIFGDHDITSINYYEAKDLCKRLNGRMFKLPQDLEGMETLYNILKENAMKTNNTFSGAWVDGITNHGEKYGSSHWVPEEMKFNFFDPDTGEPLVNDENWQFLSNEVHSYQKLVNLCLQSDYNPEYTNYENRTFPLGFYYQKCNRNWVGKVLCEFEEPPIIKIKGLCKNSPVDRDFQLLQQYVGEGNA